MDNQGETNVTASGQKGRKITLDPIRAKVIDVPWREVESLAPCGFQIEWVSGEVEDEEFTLRVGAGTGSPYMTFSYKGKGYCISAMDLIPKLVEFADEPSKDNQKGA